MTPVEKQKSKRIGETPSRELHSCESDRAVIPIALLSSCQEHDESLRGVLATLTTRAISVEQWHEVRERAWTENVTDSWVIPELGPSDE